MTSSSSSSCIVVVGSSGGGTSAHPSPGSSSSTDAWHSPPPPQLPARLALVLEGCRPEVKLFTRCEGGNVAGPRRWKLNKHDYYSRHLKRWISIESFRAKTVFHLLLKTLNFLFWCRLDPMASKWSFIQPIEHSAEAISCRKAKTPLTTFTMTSLKLYTKVKFQQHFDIWPSFEPVAHSQ